MTNSDSKRFRELDADGGSTSGKTPEDAALEDLAADQVAAEAPQGNQQLQQAVQEAEARAVRAQAELENFRKRMSRERSEDLKYAALPIMRDMLPVIDNLDRALQSAEAGQPADGLVEGVKMVLAQLLSVLEQHHCKEIPAAGEPFDPMSHEAIAQLPSEDVPAGQVLEVHQPGYRLHDRILRPTNVIVSQGPAASGAALLPITSPPPIRRVPHAYLRLPM